MDIIGGKSGKMVAYRADMDALRIQEETGLSYSSTIDGYMHACGHDAHTAIALCAIEELYKNKENLQGTIRFLFEAGEETEQGAKHLLDENALESVDAVFSLHVGNLAGVEIPSGKFTVLSTAVSAGKDIFSIEIEGKGGHGAYPSESIDPIRIAANVIIAIQSIVSMEIPSGNGAVITFGSIQGGKDSNAIPSKVFLSGTVRTQNEEIRSFISKRIQEIAENLPKAFGGKGICNIRKGSNAIVNDENLAKYVENRISAKVGAENVITRLPKALMASDDFCQFTKKTKGVYFFLSTVDKEKGTDYPHHNSKFAVDESVLALGVDGVVAILENYTKE